MVVSTSDDKALRGSTSTSEPRFQPVGLDTPLRYGRRYEFRVRMADATGGGPLPADLPETEGDAPIASMHFRRFLPPKKIRLVDQTTDGNGTTIVLERPRIDYPAAVFAGIPNAIPRLRAIYDANAVSGGHLQDVALPDPDAEFAEIRVMVRPPAFDRAGVIRGWREVYTTWRAFDSDPAAQLEVTGTFVDVAQLSDLDLSGQSGPMGSQTGPLVLPTGRDLRLELRAACRDDLGYFGNERARRSTPMISELHGVAHSEPDFFVNLDPPTALRSVFLRNDPVSEGAAPSSIQAQNDPAPVLVARLASAAGLAVSGTTLVGRPGERVVFGCNGLKHRISPEGGALTFTHVSELANQWINILRVEIDRDWTWKGAASPAFTLHRRLRLVPGGPVTNQDLNGLELCHSVSTSAATANARRDRIVLVFLDAFSAPLWHGLPYEAALRYTVRARLENQQTSASVVETTLPVTTPPHQLPQLVSAGHALSDYAADDAYSTTAPRATNAVVRNGEAARRPARRLFLPGAGPQP